MQKELEKALQRVQKPARYVGGEYGQIKKDPDKVELRAVFCFPDVYEIGMSNLGVKILYGLYNTLDYVWCERCFAPWPDMEKEMRTRGIPLYALESGDELAKFDIIAFSLSYELSYTNLINMLDLAGLPVYAAERESLSHLVIAGGCCACNPEPLADFVDVFLLGDGEEESVDFLALYREAKRNGMSKADFLLLAAQTIEGIYVPSLYKPHYDDRDDFAGITALPGAPQTVSKRAVGDLDAMYFPESIVVPSTSVVHDRIMLEVMRGCMRGCRFCQAGHAYRPIREKSPEVLFRQAKALAEQTGYDEISLTSLSTTDYTHLKELLALLEPYCNEKHIGIALPSQRADAFDEDLVSELEKMRRTGLTFACEAGTQRLRDVINKNIREEDVFKACRIAFAHGWNSVKLYFMMGLPTETDEDLDGIARISRTVVDLWRQYSSNKKRPVRVSVSVAVFVPKPCSPFQWEPQDRMEEILRKQEYLKNIMKIRNVDFSYHDPFISVLEGALARGDRRLGAVLYAAWKNGCVFDGWDELLNREGWDRAFAECGMTREYYAARRRSYDEPLPWDHIFHGVTREYMKRQAMLAEKGVASPDCRAGGCAGCGASCLIERGVCDV